MRTLNISEVLDLGQIFSILDAELVMEMLADRGYSVTLRQAARLWEMYSEDLDAGWIHIGAGTSLDGQPTERVRVKSWLWACLERFVRATEQS